MFRQYSPLTHSLAPLFLLLISFLLALQHAFQLPMLDQASEVGLMQGALFIGSDAYIGSDEYIRMLRTYRIEGSL